MTVERVSNAKSFPEVYFGLHMSEGVAEYRKPGKDPERIYIGEKAIRDMDQTFSNLPVFAGHIDEVEPETMEEHPLFAGYVIKSFYNPADGKTWAQFMITRDVGHEAIKRGWVLSNCYTPVSCTKGGEWHGVAFEREVLQGKYDHLAIVDDPRYAESIVLTEEEFKEYNAEKEAETQRFANSKGDENMGLSFFKRQKVENSKDVNFDELSVILPKSKKEFTIANLVEEHDKIMNMNGYANGDHFVKAGEEEMTVNQLTKKYNAAAAELAEMKKANEASDDMENEDEDKDREEEIDKRKNSKEGDEDEESEKSEEKSEGDKAEKKDEKQESPAEKKANSKGKSKDNFERVANAAARARPEEDAIRAETMQDRLARGKALF